MPDDETEGLRPMPLCCFMPRLPQALDLGAAIGHTSPRRTGGPRCISSSALLTWWNSQTIGTQIFTARKGKKVGEDDQGNLYYQTADGKRRWVIFKGEMEASRVPPDWHGWLHHTWDQPPTKAPLAHKPWEKPHAENSLGHRTGLCPPGSIRRSQPAARRDYEAWQPE